MSETIKAGHDLAKNLSKCMEQTELELELELSQIRQRFSVPVKGWKISMTVMVGNAPSGSR